MWTTTTPDLKKALTYDDVLLVPQYSDIESRKTIDIGNDLDDNIRLDFPILSSPMDTVTEAKMAAVIGQTGGLGIIHRYNTIEKQCEEVRNAWSGLIDSDSSTWIGAAVGVTENYFERAIQLSHSGARVICIDVAHGHHSLVERAIKTIKDVLGSSVHIMAGNVATAEGFSALEEWGADSIRVGIGNGSICSTRIQTGFGVPSLTAIFECAWIQKRAALIADGGIKTSGDIVKALAAGADLVMLGSLLAGTDQSPGEINETGQSWLKGKYKVYRGMSSKESQRDWKGSYSSNEGISAEILYKGDVRKVIQDLKNGIASGLSYSGARNIKELQQTAHFIRQTNAGQVESSTHILMK